MERLGTVAILGVGLIGGSIGLALRARQQVDRVIGIGRSLERLAEARELGAVDEISTDPRHGVAEADIAVVCTPVDRIAADVRLAAESGPPHLLVTDAGSTKRSIVETVESHPLARAVFVAAHPIAGSDRTGVRHARAELFRDRICVLTPTASTPEDRRARARAFWNSLGSRVVEMSPEAHDTTLALTSHLPHAVAAALATTVPTRLLPLAAGAYRDGSRVAAADPSLWTAIFLANRGPLLEAIDAFASELSTLRSALVSQDAGAIHDWYGRARSRRLDYREPGDGSDD